MSDLLEGDEGVITMMSGQKRNHVSGGVLYVEVGTVITSHAASFCV